MVTKLKGVTLIEKQKNILSFMKKQKHITTMHFLFYKYFALVEREETNTEAIYWLSAIDVVEKYGGQRI